MDELIALVSDAGILPSSKRYSSFMPSLEDQGQFWFIAEPGYIYDRNLRDDDWNGKTVEPEYMIEISGMMIGMGKRSSWGRSNLPWAKRWLTSGGLFVNNLLTFRALNYVNIFSYLFCNGFQLFIYFRLGIGKSDVSWPRGQWYSSFNCGQLFRSPFCLVN